MEQPKTLLEAIRLYADPDVAQAFVVRLRWPNGIACPRYGCGSASVAYLAKYRRWYCNECKRQFSAKTGTIFEESPVGFDKWLPALWLLSSNRNGISSCELARGLGVTQKTAWFMLHRIRLAMKDGTFEQLRGSVEVDETYIGGKVRNPRPGRTGEKPTGPAFGKTIAMGFRERGGIVRAFVVKDVRRETLLPKIREHIAPGATVYTDSLPSYRDVQRGYAHYVINHAQEYVRDHHVHTNSIENFWSVLKRTLGGTYICARPKHLDRYLDEQIFRFNERETTDGPRFAQAVKGSEGKRITYKALIGKTT
jgi:transposase-like protein